VLADIALELNPKSVGLRVNVSTMYIKHGQKEKARDYFKGALEIDPKLEEAKRQLIRLKKKNRLEIE
jgi:Tfp pilus assembly protein PilF